VYRYDPEGDVAWFRAAAAELVGEGARSLQLLGAVGVPWGGAAFDAAVQAIGVPVFGGVFPQIIVDGVAHARGAVLIGHRAEARVAVFAEGEGASGVEALRGAASMVVYVDATANVGEFAAALFDALGAGPAWVGGGAGALDFVRRPVVVTPSGLRAGVAVVAGFLDRVAVGVAHGWEPIGEAMLVSEAEGSEVISLDWRPALDVYREVVQAHAGQPLSMDDFYALASRYPLMIESIGGEGVVRDPLTVTADGHLRCAGDIQPNSTARVATGDAAGMLRAARAARERATVDGAAATLSLTIDCISRALLLGDRIGDELAAMAVPGVAQVGALTIGELASAGDAFLQFHNKTSVVAVWGTA
jgi:hypothetical protein